MIAETAKVYPNVKLGKNVIIEDYCIIGAPKAGAKEASETVIGDGAVIRSHTVIYAGNKIGDNFQTGNKVNIRENNNIGNNVSVGTLTVVEHQIEIQDNVRIHSQAFIPEFSVLKSGCWIGPNVVLTNAKYPNQPDTKDNLKGPVIGEEAVVGANATILPDIEVGARSLVGAGTVLTRSVEEDMIVFGEPLKQKKRT